MDEPLYVLPNDYKRMELALGVKGAEAWRAKNNLIVGVPPEEPAMDETEADYEGDEGYDDEELPPEKPAARSQLAVAGTGGLGGTDSMYGAYQQAQANVVKQMETNLALLNAAQRRLRERRIGPSESEKWLAIAAALGKPTRTGAFGESLGNLAETLGDQRAAARKAQEERESLLEQYGLKTGAEQLRMLQTGATQAGQAYRAAAAADAAARRAAMPKMTYAEGEWRIQPGTGGVPPMNARGQYVVSSEEEARNVPKGRKFILAGDPSGKEYYGQ